jgi:hypothetical protein
MQARSTRISNQQGVGASSQQKWLPFYMRDAILGTRYETARKSAREVRRATLILTASMNTYSKLSFSKLSFSKLSFASAVLTTIRRQTVDLNLGYEF